MLTNQILVSFHVVERQYNRNLITWTYPSISSECNKFLLEHCFLCHRQSGYFCVRKHDFYLQIRQSVNVDRSVAIIIITTEYFPQKYKQLCDIFHNKYAKCHNPVELVKLYLDLFTVGSCAIQDNQRFYLKKFQSASSLKDFIQLFGLKIILIYNAILLKRRVILFSTHLESLQNDLHTISHLVPCRKPSEYLQPFVLSGRELKSLPFYVVATTNADLIKEQKIYDIFVDLETQNIVIAPHAQAIMKMANIHKELAKFLVQLSQSELVDAQVIAEISKKTNEILDLFKNIGATSSDTNLKMITIGDLKSNNFHPDLENFLFNLGLAENIMML